jgi:uncharacterized protein YlaI
MISPHGCYIYDDNDEFDDNTVSARLLSNVPDQNHYCDVTDNKIEFKKNGAEAPVVLGQINGVRFCGKRSGSSYLETPQAIDGGVCPTGYKSCHETSSPPSK